jgi:MATE family multidrug resistance protein
MDNPQSEILNPQSENKPLWGLGEVLRLSWPASLSMLSGTLMMFVDGLMVARTGPEALGAQFVGGILSFVPTSLMLGVLTVVNTYTSQNFGAGRLKRCGQYAWAGLFVALAFALPMQVLNAAAGPVIRLFGHEPAVQQLEVLYFRYMIVNMIPFLTSRVLEQFFFGLGRSGIVLISAFAANAFNVLANWVLIYGHWGFPAMGLEGAAIGTVGSTVLMLMILLAVFWKRNFHEHFGTRDVRAVRRNECFDIIRIGWPAGVQFCNDVTSWSLVTAYLIGKFFGTDHLAANTACVRYLGLSFMPAVGVGIATTALVGRYIGEGRPDLARRRAHAALLAAVTYMGFCALAFFLFRHDLVRFYIRIAPSENLSPAEAAARVEEIVRIGGLLLLCAAVFQIFDATAIIFNGALRGAGDTFWPMIIMAALSWGVQFGGGLVIVHAFPELQSFGPWLAASAFIIVLALLFAWRFESGRWRKIDLLKNKEVPPPLPPMDSALEV